MATLFVPLLIDCHVHFREPGLTHKADMETEGAAAYFGGIGTVCDMPNTSPPTQSVAAFQDKVDRSKRVREQCDIRFFFGATDDEHLSELRRLWTDESLRELKAHCCGLKLYLDNSTGDMKAATDVVRKAFAMCAELDIVLVAHCEHSHVNEIAAKEHPADTVAAHSNRRPAESEVKSVGEAIALAAEFSTPLHIAHLSTGGALQLVTEAKQRGLRVTCEVCPHHLFLTTDDYPELQSRIKVNPPIRCQQQEDLWQGLLNGRIDCIATDHAPHLPSEKALGALAPSGMPGVEVVLPLMLSVVAGHWPHPRLPKPHALDTASFALTDIKRLMFDNPNRIFRLGACDKPALELSTAGERVITDDSMHSKCGWTPYHGWKLHGSFVRVDKV